MKNFLLITATLLLLSSCSKTVTEKAESLVKDDVTENVSGCSSYSTIELKVDSAYAPLENPELYKLFDKYVKAMNSLTEHYDMILEMQTKMGKFTDMYSDELIAKLNPIINALEKHVALLENIDRMLDMPQQFSGYKAVHQYTMNVNGKDVEQKDFVMFNKDMTAITHRMSYKDYEFASSQIKILKTGVKTSIETFRNTIETAKKLAE